MDANDPASATAGSASAPVGGSSQRSTSGWARRWPEATASLIAVAISLATIAALSELAPAAPPPLGIVGYLAGVIVGIRVAGLDEPRGWVVVPVMTLAVLLIVEGVLLALPDLRLR
jgi:hypothetical protein